MATSSIESVGQRADKAPRPRGLFTALKAGAAVLVLTAGAAAATEGAPAPTAHHKTSVTTMDTVANGSYMAALVKGAAQVEVALEYQAALDRAAQEQKIAEEAVVARLVAAQVQAQAEAAAAAAAAQQKPAYTPAPRGTSYQASGSDEAFLACTRAHESDSAGGYSAVSPGGTYRGAYQFLPSTWNSTAETAGRSDLVGVDPAQASPADQDAMAIYLYHEEGNQPWEGRC